ncbi:MAG: SIMPL domain-containing protein [Chitinophagaceae bacterium]
MKRTFLLVAVLLLGIFGAMAQNNNASVQRTISANGTAWKEVTPDEIYVQVSLREYNKKNNDKVDIETIRNQFLQNARQIGLTEKEITVQSYTGWNGNIIIYKKNKKNNPDLKAGIVYLVKLNGTQQMDQLVNILDDDATQNFFVSKYDYSKMEELKKELQIEAAKDAKEKAAYTAAAIGEAVGKAITIDSAVEVGQNAPRLYATYAKAAVADNATASAPMDVDFKKIKVQYNIQVTFGLL